MVDPVPASCQFNLSDESSFGAGPLPLARRHLPGSIAPPHDVLHVLGDQVDRHRVLGSSWHDHVSVFLGGEAELFKGGFYQGGVLKVGCENCSYTL